MGEKIERKITIVEGRELNQKMARQLVEAATQNGFKARLVKSIDETKVIDGKMDEIFSDFVLWRGLVKCSSAFMVERMIVWLNLHNKITLNTKMVTGSRFSTSSKIFQHGILSEDPLTKEHILPMYPAISKTSTLKLVDDGLIDYPFLMKPDFGTRGEEIYTIKNREEIENFRDNFPAFSIEPYTKSKYDWRVFVLGGVALGVMRKVGNEKDEFNFEAKSAGWYKWNEEDPEISEEVCRLATHASAISGLEYSGVDIIRDDKTGKFIILETNYSGGWQNGFEKATGVNVPVAIVEWFSDRAELFEKTVPEAVKDYTEKRLKYLPVAAREKYTEILEFKTEVKKVKEECLAVLGSDAGYSEKLQAAYVIMKNGWADETVEMRIKDLISMVEKYEISDFGNFIGKNCGVLEDAIEDTAYYVAVSSKLNA